MAALFISSFFTSSAKFNESDAGNVSLFQIKVFSRNIKETTLARYFIIVIRTLVLRDKSLGNILQQDSVVFPSCKPPCFSPSLTFMLDKDSLNKFR